MADAPQPVAGGSGINQNQNQNQNQNVVINPAAQGAAAQLAQQILANTNVTLKQEIVKIPEFFGGKSEGYCHCTGIYSQDWWMPSI